MRALAVVTMIVGMCLLGHPFGGDVTAQAPWPSSGWMTDATSHRPVAQVNEDGNVSAQVTLGEPGTVFRYVETFGVTEQAYPSDFWHLNSPNGLFIDGSDNLYAVEGDGQRLLKVDSAGNPILTIGTAGLRLHDPGVLNNPEAVALDSDGDIWIAEDHCLMEYDQSGNFKQIFPDYDNCPWCEGTDNQHFNDPIGLAFDSTGRMFVSDGDNHRVQVYDFDLAGKPVYNTTIGVTSVPGSDNSHFNKPTHVAFDSSNRLYVVDMDNYRVQRCVYSAGSWMCSTFFGVTGEAGTDLNHLSDCPAGVQVKGSNVFITDLCNQRILKCTTTGTCSLFAGVTGEIGTDNAHFHWPVQAAVDSGGNVYVSDSGNDRVQKFNSTGVHVGTWGFTDEPYEPDTSRYNSPWGITVAADGSIYFAEERGLRLVKLDGGGFQQWTVGQAGVYAGDGVGNGLDNEHFGNVWCGPAGSVAVSSGGLVYVPDACNHRVQIYTTSGSYFTTLGGAWGTGNYEFKMPYGVRINPTNGDIYVVDMENHRIQVYSSSRVYKATIGETGVSGSDNMHFEYPKGVALDTSGNIYVAEEENRRVQKCTLSGTNYSCSTFAGVTGEWGDDFGHFAAPYDVAVDASGRVYVVDSYNDRVQVFDSTGAYLTTIGGRWGTQTGDLRSPRGITVDTDGNVYITDATNHRIQKFAPGVPGWSQMNINGFGDKTNDGSGINLRVFGDHLYAALGHDAGAHMWRTADGSSWTQVTGNGLGNPDNGFIRLGAVFGNDLFVMAWNEATGCEVFRSSDGLIWAQVASHGFGDANNVGAGVMMDFDGYLYATTWNYSTGMEVWRTGDGTTWVQVNDDGFGDANNVVPSSIAVFGERLYVAVSNFDTGTELWRTSNGTDWEQVNDDGFGDPMNHWPTTAVYDGYLYVGTANDSDDTYVGTSTQIWRSADGTTWNQVVGDGFGDDTNGGSDTLTVFDSALYSATYNRTSGTQIRKTIDGIHWEKVALDGWGDSNNYSTYGKAVFKNHFFLAAANEINGAEVWRYDTPATTRVRIEPAQTTAYLSNAAPLSVTLTVENVADLGGFDTDLTYDPDILAFEDVTLGSFLAQSDRQFYLLGPNVDSGQVSFGAYSVGTGAGPEGSGTLAVVTFAPQALGTSGLDQQDTQLIDTSAEVVAAEVYSASVTVLQTISGDLDGDCDVDIVDVMLVASRWDSEVGDPNYGVQYDLDGDDDIDVADIMRVAIHWGERCESSGMSTTQGQVSTSAGPVIELSPAAATVGLDQTRAVVVTIQDASNLGGFEFCLNFDPSKVQVTGVSLGDFLGSTGRNTGTLGPDIDNIDGVLYFGGFSYGTAGGPDGDGVLATITFSGSALGNSALDLGEVQVTDKIAVVQPASAVNDGQITVRIQTDVTPAQGGTVRYTDPQGITTTVQVPANAVADTVELVYTPVLSTTTAPADFSFAGQAFNLDVYHNGELQEGFVFTQPATVQIDYTDENLGDLNEGSLLLYYWDGEANPPAWINAGATCFPADPTQAYIRYPNENRFDVSICHLTEFGLFGQAGGEDVYLPMVVKEW